VRIGCSYLDCQSLTLDDGVRIGHFNVLWGCGIVRVGACSRIGLANILRGGTLIELGSYSVIGRFNVINAIPEAEVINEFDSTFRLGHGAVVVSEHRIDFTDLVTIGRRSILGGRNSSLWTHNRQQTHPIEIGEFCYVGSEIRMAPGSALPARSIVGIGAVVTNNITEEWTLIGGVPAKVIRPLDDEDRRLVYYKTRVDLPDIPGIDDCETAPQS
jgi:acetyltransferase-like isoleucine patch superfamily enzyme